MELEYKKDGNNKFLIIDKIEVNEDEYSLQMLENNRIKSLVPMKIKTVNNQSEIQYNITGLMSIKSLHEHRLMKEKDIIQFIRGIKICIDRLKEYLLSADNLVLEMSHIYQKRGNNEFLFCYCPVENDDFQLNMKKLLNELLDHIDHNDRNTVMVAYSMQQMSVHDDFTLDDLLSCAIKEEVEEEIQQEKIVEKDEFNEPTEDEIKETVWDKIKKLFRRKEYKNEDELFDVIEKYEEEPSMELIETQDNVDEDATMLLAGGGLFAGITLKSLNAEDTDISPDKYPYIIGKSRRSCDYTISSPVISRVHVRILQEQGNYYLEDLKSTNGTFINGERINAHDPQIINLGDHITLADIDFVIE